MAKTSPTQFVREVRQEGSKVTWPSRKEVTVTTVMVFIFVFIAAIFFLVIDMGLAAGIKALLGIGA